MNARKLQEKLDEANQRLKSGGVGLKIYKRGEKLSLRGTFPPQPGEEKSKQRYLALDVHANPAGIKRAESEAQKVASAIALKEFRWEDYLDLETFHPQPTIEKAVADFEKDYFAVRGRTPKTETTWKMDYFSIFKQIEPGTRVTEEVLLNLILSTEANTKTRMRTCNACSSLARFLNLNLDAGRYRGNYSGKQVQPREIPSDELIAEHYRRIKNPQWQWVYGIIACYGLRNHEVFHVDPDSLQKSPGILKVTEGKTDEQVVFPVYPEWWKKWKLWEVKFPPVTGKNNRDLGIRVSQLFGRNELGQAYNLRHAWAILPCCLGWMCRWRLRKWGTV